MLTLFGFLVRNVLHRFVDMINEVKYIRGNAEHMRAKRPTDTWRNHPTMSVKRNALRKQSDTQHKIDAMMCKISDRIERKDERRNKRNARKRTMAR